MDIDYFLDKGKEFFYLHVGDFLLSVFIIFIGILIGKGVYFVFKEIASKTKIREKIKGAFVDLFLITLKWSIYLFFISLGIKQLNIASVSDILSKFFMIVPAIVGSLILFFIGLLLASYLKNVILESGIKENVFLSSMIYLFVLFVFGIYSFNMALVSIDVATKNYLILILVSISSLYIGYYFTHKNN